MTTKLLAVSMMTFALAACGGDEDASKEEDKPKEETPKETVKLEFAFEDTRIEITGESPVHVTSNNMWGGLHAVPKMKLTLDAKANTEATMTFGDADVELAADEVVKVTVDTLPYLQRVLAEAETEKGLHHLAKVEIPWTVSVGGEKKLDEKLTLDSHALIRIWAGSLTETPMLLEGEEPGPPSSNTVLVVDKGMPTLLGEPKKFADIDFVAFKSGKTRDKECGPYLDDTGAKKKMLAFTFSDTELRLHERRSGKEVATKMFLAKGKCPAAIREDWVGDSATVSKETMAKWVKSKVPR